MKDNFQLPADGWYNIETKGDHPNKKSDLVQIMDDDACQSIVNRFNSDADKPGFPGMLIDHEHFKHDDDKETRAYGWLMRLQNRRDGIYGQIRWTDTGRTVVEGGDYRFFSTEYDPSDLEILTNKRPRRVRPLRLDGLTLKNMNNNKGQRPITNRDTAEDDGENLPEAFAASKHAYELSRIADSPGDHDKAAAAHLAAAKLQAAAGHERTAKFHEDAAATHSYTSETMRGVANNRQHENPMNTDSQNSAQARGLAQQLAAQTGRSFDDCWRDVRRTHSHLFPVHNRVAAHDTLSGVDPVDEPIHSGATATQIYHMGRGNIQNRLAIGRSRPVSADAPLESADLAAAVEVFQHKNGIATFTDAWTRLKNRKPGLFGL